MYIEHMSSVPLQLVRYPSLSEAPIRALLCQTIRPSHNGCCHNGRVHASAAQLRRSAFHKLRGFTLLACSYAR